MANPRGTPIWYEYLAHDIDQAGRFFTEVIGWQVVDSGMPGIDYRILSAPDGAPIGGLMTLPPGAPTHPGWLVYFGVDDVDATVAAVRGAGGAVHMPPTTLDGIGRMALVGDPQGAPFYVMRGASEAPSTSFQGPTDATPGHMVWNELLAPDQDTAMRFYGPLFGWRHEGAMPMGPLGDYKFIHAGPVGLGASMNVPPGETQGWRFYVLVPEVDSVAERLTAAGGRVLHGPDQIPGGDYAVVAEDLFGARFGFVGPRRGTAAA
ncbi:VOC family protein [Teichococcus vastitatis]|uniref:VOC family protein n=1 Tax=Teichococcus vastitatis TaxID=2307076 RepID=A0ABS9W919_9PROT|nr:VOC family protein [Pseudoroseomonas vastitatis]MCI0755468.1 VOC family protein [Pseudoroseomonas vastitatis]